MKQVSVVRLRSCLPSIDARRAPQWWRSRRTWFIALCAAVVGYEIFALFLRQPGENLDVRGRQLILVDAVGRGSRIGQTFVARAEGLDGLTLWFRAPGKVIVAEVRCELMADAGPDFEPLYRWVERLEIRGRQAYTFTFPPVVPSKRRTLRFTMQLTRPVQGPLSVDASADNAMPQGALLIDGREQWGDLAFRTRAATRYRQFRANIRGLPASLRQPIVHLALLGLYNYALMAFVYYMLVAPETW